MNNLKIIGLLCSIRGGKLKPEYLKKLIYEKSTYEELSELIYELGNNKQICNSEALLMTSMFGVKEQGVDFDIIDMTKKPDLDINSFQGVVVSTPVYYGDRSAYADDFVRYFGNDYDTFKDKVVGVVSAGAKRNGGQETTNIYMLNDFLNRGSVITGNGPPTAQYGGTGWAGNVGSIINDDFGLKTSYGTGRQVATYIKALTVNLENLTDKINITILSTSKSSELKFQIKRLNEFFNRYNINHSFVDISELNIRRCLACPVCPNGNIDDFYTCVIQNDDMKEVHKKIRGTDCLIIAVDSSEEIDNKMLQTFIERSRFIRRNHFELNNIPYSYFGVTNYLNDIMHLRIMTSFLRHNMISVGPYYKLFDASDKSVSYENIHLNYYVKKLVELASKIKLWKQETNQIYEYIPVGYEDSKHGKEKAYRD